MTIQDIISIIDEETTVNVWRDGEIIATYDGKNSIPEELNGETVKSISAGHFTINLDI